MIPFDPSWMPDRMVSFLMILSDPNRGFKVIVYLQVDYLKNGALGSLNVIENDTIRSGIHDFLLTFYSNHRPISHRFQDKRRFPSKIANYSTRRVFIAAAKGVILGLGWISAQRSEKTRMMGYQMVDILNYILNS